MSGHMELTGSPVKKVGHEKPDASPGAPAVGSKFVGPGHAETVHASEIFEKAGLVAAHLAALHDAFMLERGLLPGTSLPDSEAPPIPPVFAESPWRQLKPVSLTDMKVGKTHRRHVLEGCLCVKSLKINSVVNVLEEDSGLATKLILTNAVPMRASMAQAQCCYPEGARVAVRDPYLTRFPDGMVGVLVERPADIAFLSRPENNGENGTTIYGSVGSEGYHDDRNTENASREHESFSRKLHLFEQHESVGSEGNRDERDTENASREHESFSRKLHLFQQQSISESSHSLVMNESHEKIHLSTKMGLLGKSVLDSGGSDSIARGLYTRGSQQDDLTNSRSSGACDEVKEVPLSTSQEEFLASNADDEVMEKGLSNESSDVSPTPDSNRSLMKEDGHLGETSPREADGISHSSRLEASLGDSVVSQEGFSSNSSDQFSPPEMGNGVTHEGLSSNCPVESSPPPADSLVEKQLSSKNILPPESDSVPFEAPVHLDEEIEVKERSAGEVDVGTQGGQIEANHAQEDSKLEPNIPHDVSAESLEEPHLVGREVDEEALDQEPWELVEGSGAEEDSQPTGLGESVSQEQALIPDENSSPMEEIVEKETHLETSEEISVARKPNIRKQFQRSDSLLAVHEIEDTKARSGEWASGAGILPEYSEVKSGDTACVNVSHTPENDVKLEGVLPEEKLSEDVSADSGMPDPLDSASANDLRVLGNQLFAEEKYKGATDLYTKSILRAEREEQRHRGLASAGEVLLGYSNRAEAWIRLNQYEKALEDAEKALSRDPNHLKSLFRKGRALLGLGEYEEALSTLQVAALRAPSDKDLQSAVHESSIGVQQSRQGVYDLSNYYLKGKHLGESPSCADYLGPVIVSDVGRGRGLGLVLTKDVDAGELLLVSNPIAFLQLQGPDEVSQAFVSGKVQEAFRKICENAHASNRGLQKLPMLFDGERKVPSPPLNLLSSSSNGEPVMQGPLDAAHLRRIIQLNAINGNATMGWKNLPGSGEQDQKVEHWGLWWLPSFINHSCLPNSSLILVGRALFVFASRDLRAGDEVTRSYFDVFQPLEQRRELSTKGWGFVCHCRRCKLEDALHAPLSKATRRYTKLMELASRSKSEYVTDEKLSETQTSAALKFFQKLENKLKDFKLNSSEDNWVRSSFLHYIDMISGDHELHPHLEFVVEAMATVCPGSESTLHMAVVAKDSARRTRGKKSAQFKSANQRALNICRSTYGKQKLGLLQSIVDKSDYQV